MGRIVGIDAAIVIYMLQRTSAFFGDAKKLFRKVEAGSLCGIFSAIGMVEVLTGPKKSGEFQLAQQYKASLGNFPNLAIVPISERIIDTASSLRARYGIRTPDAIHVATAIAYHAQSFITEDKALFRVREIKVRSLSQYVK